MAGNPNSQMVARNRSSGGAPKRSARKRRNTEEITFSLSTGTTGWLRTEAERRQQDIGALLEEIISQHRGPRDHNQQLAKEGVTLVREIIGGVGMSGKCRYDIKCGDGLRVEVKTSLLGFQARSKSAHPAWHWGRIEKEADWLILVGVWRLKNGEDRRATFGLSRGSNGQRTEMTIPNGGPLIPINNYPGLVGGFGKRLTWLFVAQMRHVIEQGIKYSSGLSYTPGHGKGPWFRFLRNRRVREDDLYNKVFSAEPPLLPTE